MFRHRAFRGLIALAAIAAPLSLGGCCCASCESCDNDGDVEHAEASVTPVGEWTAESIGGDDLPGNVRTPTLTVAHDGAVSGMSGVNRFTGRADADAWSNGAFRVGPVASTRMAGPPEAMELERRFLDGLSRADTFRLPDGSLVLLAGDEELLRFREAE